MDIAFGSLKLKKGTYSSKIGVTEVPFLLALVWLCSFSCTSRIDAILLILFFLCVVKTLHLEKQRGASL